MVFILFLFHQLGLLVNEFNVGQQGRAEKVLRFKQHTHLYLLTFIIIILLSRRLRFIASEFSISYNALV